jgi:hypothetical protein
MPDLKIKEYNYFTVNVEVVLPQRLQVAVTAKTSPFAAGVL